MQLRAEWIGVHQITFALARGFVAARHDRRGETDRLVVMTTSTLNFGRTKGALLDVVEVLAACARRLIGRLQGHSIGRFGGAVAISRRTSLTLVVVVAG